MEVVGIESVGPAKLGLGVTQKRRQGVKGVSMCCNEVCGPQATPLPTQEKGRKRLSPHHSSSPHGALLRRGHPGGGSYLLPRSYQAARRRFHGTIQHVGEGCVAFSAQQSAVVPRVLASRHSQADVFSTKNLQALVGCRVLRPLHPPTDAPYACSWNSPSSTFVHMLCSLPSSASPASSPSHATIVFQLYDDPLPALCSPYPSMHPVRGTAQGGAGLWYAPHQG
ncbi:unnamed protein product [Lota lota]